MRFVKILVPTVDRTKRMISLLLSFVLSRSHLCDLALGVHRSDLHFSFFTRSAWVVRLPKPHLFALTVEYFYCNLTAVVGHDFYINSVSRSRAFAGRRFRDWLRKPDLRGRLFETWVRSRPAAPISAQLSPPSSPRFVLLSLGDQSLLFYQRSG